MKPSVLCTLITAVTLVAATSAFAQKKEPTSPTEPKVDICHNGHTISVAQAAVPAHLAHGDSVGPCASEPNVLICHRGRTISVAQSAVSAHLAHGDTAGECSSVARSQVSAPVTTPAAARTEVTATATTPAQPVLLATPAAKTAGPAVSPLINTPVLNGLGTFTSPNVTPTSRSVKGADAEGQIALCYKGSTVKVPRTSVQTYLSIGATIGACEDSAPATEETKQSSETGK